MTPFSEKYFKYIKANKFLPKYCGMTYNTVTKNKMRGIYNGNPYDFTPEEKKIIKAGIKTMARDLK